MTKQIKLEIFATETIKPHSQIPDDKKTYHFSYLDQLALPKYMHILFFYPKTNASVAETSEILKTSLSRTLTLFYPFAGRLKSENLLDCNDEGAEFKEALVDCDLDHYLRIADVLELKKLLPVDPTKTKPNPTSSLLQIQVTYFKCGATAIGFALTHKLGDGINIHTFMKSWADNAIGSKSHEELINPSFIAPSIFPPKNPTTLIPHVFNAGDTSKLKAKRFILDVSKIKKLKSQVSSPAVPRPSRVEAVSALIWKCNITASQLLSAPPLTNFVFSRAVNLRGRHSPPLPNSTIGNLIGTMLTQADKEVVDMSELVSLLRKKNKEFRIEDFFATNEEIGELMGSGGNVEFFGCTSLCGLGFYQVDFGWGNPTWITFPATNYPNVAVLCDTKDGEGVEMWLCMTQAKMDLFEHNPEFLAFATNAGPPMPTQAKSSL